MMFLWFALDSWRASIAPKFFMNFKTSCLIIPHFLAKYLVSLYAPRIGWFFINVHKFSPKTCCNSNHFLWPPHTTNFTFLVDNFFSLHLACQCHRCLLPRILVFMINDVLENPKKKLWQCWISSWYLDVYWKLYKHFFFTPTPTP